MSDRIFSSGSPEDAMNTHEPDYGAARPLAITIETPFYPQTCAAEVESKSADETEKAFLHRNGRWLQLISASKGMLL